jgi:O-antigen/teichoic acid export membrane protein
MTDVSIKRLGRNLSYNALSFFVSFVVNFALLPFIISHVGKEIYGIYMLVMTITGYLFLCDFGMTSGTIKYVAEYLGSKDYGKVNEVISASFSILLIIGFLGSLILVIFSFYFDKLFTVQPENQILVKNLFLVAAAASVIVWPGKVFESALQGFQKYGWLAINNIGGAIGTGLSAYVIFSHNMGITLYLVVFYAIFILRYLAAFTIIYGKLLTQKIMIFYYSKGILAKLFSFGTYTFLAVLLTIIILQFDNILIGAYLTVASVAVYAVVYNLQHVFRVLNGLLGGPLFPFNAEMEGQSQFEKQQTMVYKGTKYMSLIFVSGVIITIIYASPLINKWMGPGFAESILPAQILLSFWIFNGTLEVGMGMVKAKGIVKPPFKIGAVNATCNLALSLVLIQYYGIVGVVLGTTIPMIIINFPLCIYLILKYTNITLKDYFNQAIKNNLKIYLLAGVLSIATQVIFPPTNLLMVLLEMTVVYLIALSVGYRWILSMGEREEIYRIVRACI